MNASVMEDKPTIYIKTLGGFSLRVGDKEITDNSNQSKKPWCLLEYLVVFQKKSISPGELINIVWADDPGVNPGGALKTLMFRSRKLLEPLGIPPQKLLVQQRGSYCWTQDYLSVLDIDQFESICTRVLNHDMDEDWNCTKVISFPNPNMNPGLSPSVHTTIPCTRNWFIRR